MQRSNTWLIFIAPTIVLILAMVVFPLFYSLWLSLHGWTILTRVNPPFVGLDNYARALTDPQFWNGLQITAVILIVALTIETVLAMSMAMLLARSDIVGRNVFRVLAFIPALINPIATGYTFHLLFHPNGGAVNAVLGWITLHPVNIDWIGSPSTALTAIIVTDIWQWTPFLTIVFLAARLGLPREPFEAARIDRASPWLIFRRVTLPGLTPAITVMLLIRGIDIFKLFDTIYAITGGGPGTATETLGYYTYLVGFNSFELGYAAALSWVLNIILFILATIFLRTAGRRLLA
jgi:multiple sugar transport system permease protein